MDNMGNTDGMINADGMGSADSMGNMDGNPWTKALEQKRVDMAKAFLTTRPNSVVRPARAASRPACRLHFQS